MATRLHLYKGIGDGEKLESAHVTVPHCPMFVFDGENNTEEVRDLLARGFRISGHTDD